MASARLIYFYNPDTQTLTPVSADNPLPITIEGGVGLTPEQLEALASDAELAAAITALNLGALAMKDLAEVPEDLNTTGTPDGTTFLRGDGAWAEPPGGDGAPQVFVWDPVAEAYIEGGRFFLGPVDPDVSYTPQAGDSWMQSGSLPGAHLGQGSYTHASDTFSAKSTTSTTFADVDAVNLAVTTVFPTSGKLRVVCQGAPHSSAAKDDFWGLRDGNGNISGTQRWLGQPGSGGVMGHTTIEWIIEGAPGVPITVKWAWRTASGTAYLASGPTYGPVTIDVFAA
jgi:hypothetical protein